MKKKILIIDDEPELVKAMEIRLKSQGYDVDFAYDGDEGIQKAFAQKPDLIILDIIMPKMNGFDVCQVLKKDQRTKDVPILILTASQQRELERKCLEVGANASLMKPFEAEELLVLIDDLLKVKNESQNTNC